LLRDQEPARPLSVEAPVDGRVVALNGLDGVPSIMSVM
jgi:hypothetical protein